MKRLVWLVPILCVALAAGLSVITANAAPNGTTTLSAGQTLTIKANGCNLKVKKETPALVQVVCKAATNVSAPSERNPSAKVILNVGQKQKVLANQCDLRVTKKSAAVVKVKCVGSENASPTATKTATQGAGATNTHTPTRTATRTRTQTATATRTRTPTPTATATTVTGTTKIVSVASDGTQGDNPVMDSDMSADGRYVVFSSYASTLVNNDNNWNCDGYYGENCSDVFVRDVQTGVTTLVSRASDGTQGDNSSQHASISADGRYVAFSSVATNLIANNTNCSFGVCYPEVYVRDLQTGTTTIASVKSDGSQVLYSGASNPHISADGRYVEFQTTNGGLGCPSGTFQVDFLYVHDMQTGTTTCASVNSNGDGLEAAGYPTNARGASISGDGRYVSFISNANNMGTGDTKFPCNDTHTQDVEHCYDVYVHDMQTGTTTRASVALDGINGANDIGGGVMTVLSADGRYVMFDSWGSNLVSGDNNIGCGEYGYGPGNCMDTFVYDRQTGTTTLVTLDPDGNQFDENSFGGDMSSDGRYVTFSAGYREQEFLRADWAGSGRDVLSARNTLFDWRAFVRDLQTGQTSDYSLYPDGSAVYGSADLYATTGISADGRYALFTTDLSMVDGDANGYLDLFLRKRW